MPADSEALDMRARGALTRALAEQAVRHAVLCRARCSLVSVQSGPLSVQSGPLLLTREGLAIRTGSAQRDADTLAWAAAASELWLLLSLAWCVCLSSLGACPALPPQCVGQAIACAVRGPRACVLARSFVMPQSWGGRGVGGSCERVSGAVVLTWCVFVLCWFGRLCPTRPHMPYQMNQVE